MTCRPTDAGYLVDGEHYDECETDDCKGCWPCVPRTDSGTPLAHCTARKRCTTHVRENVLTCPKCIAKTRDDLATIERMTAELLPEAVIKGVDSEAANLAGPADPVGWSERKIHAVRHGYQHTLDEDDPHHPLSVLGRWDMMLREDYDHPTREKLSASSAIDYLNRQLDRFAADEEQDFPLFVREVAACRAHIESVLHNERGPDTGAPCPKCSTLTERGPALRLRHDDHDRTGSRDVWRCPDCKSEWTQAEYRQRVGSDYVRHAPELTLADMAARTKVPSGTLRRWASKRRMQNPGEPVTELPPLLKPSGRSEDGRKVYRVSDVEALRNGVCCLTSDDSREQMSTEDCA